MNRRLPTFYSESQMLSLARCPDPSTLKGGVHACRHSFATRALNKGMNLQSVRAMLGHVRIATTAPYLGIATRALVAE